MARNTYKVKSREKKTFSLDINFINDRKFQIAAGLAFLLSGFFLLLAFISYLKTGQADHSVVEAFLNTNIKESGQEVNNWFGVVGAIIAHYFIFNWFGIASLLIPPLLFIVAHRILYQRQTIPISKAFLFTTFYLIWTSLILGYFLLASDELSIWGFLSGGIGFEMAIVLESLMGWGSLLLILFLFIVFNMYFFDITRIGAFDEIVSFFHSILEKFKQPEGSDKGEESTNITSVIEQIKKEVAEEDVDLFGDEEDDKDILADSWNVKPQKPSKSTKPEPSFSFELPDELQGVTNDETQLEQEEEEELEMEVASPSFEEKSATKSENYDPTLDLPHYKYPSPSLLIDYPPKDVMVSKEELEQNKDKIVETLVNFKIGISSIKATIGPTVTLYEIVPEAGVKISKIKNLEDDIALSLAALGIRIIAPIPGRGTIGIEVPNKNREMVDIKSVITTEKFMKSDMELPVVLGKTISNEVYVTDLAKMPHLLMAGATGQGKSVGLNVVLTSLIYKKHPSQLKFVLVDPKKVELTLFNKLERHFLAMLPDSEEAIITDTTKVVHTLNSLCIEMDNRYNLLKDAGCRNLKEYNKKFTNRRLNPQKGHTYLPYIVLVIDELADLMMTAGKEIETPIARLAQLARAIGIHLIVATQRPSVNVITGIIKANFPARLSFRVTSKVDSRTILDAGGAEQLIGMGDMLLSLGSDITRLQCAFVDTPEVDDLCEFVGDQRGYDSAYMLPEFVGEEESGIGEVDLTERDALFEDAARLIVVHQQGSTSLIQRKMKLGYNRAGRLIDQLEAAGIVGPFEGSKAREVLIKDEYSLEQLLSEIGSKY
ncbi:MAG: DNA translocase FtsK 4TM domain-containing protein [Cyclobacteriaceae bacterium]|nr:DNA translocase FtsK 4TM domain-containing protein [Cyclobacteriaceae bacterium HetDA_MAG_MS6]